MTPCHRLPRRNLLCCLLILALGTYWAQQAQAVERVDGIAPTPPPMPQASQPLVPGTLPEVAPHDSRDQATLIKARQMHFGFDSGRLRVFQGTRELSLGFLGSDAELYFAGSPVAQAEARLYSRYNKVSFVFRTLTTAAILADIGYLIYFSTQANDTSHVTNTDIAVFWSVFAGALVLDIPARLFQNMATTHLGLAVQVLNEDVVDHTLLSSAQKQATLGSQQQKSLGLALNAHF